MIQRRPRGNILVGGARLVSKSVLDEFDFSQGSFFPPTVMADVGIEDELWQEEIFGPVVVVKAFSVRTLEKQIACVYVLTKHSGAILG